ncbi:hypothetical protein LMIY3S_02927 [Labrys miyagiensis]
MNRLVTAAMALATTFGFADAGHAASKLSVSFSWCSGTPATKVSGIPKGTTKLKFLLKDHQASGYHHGGGTFPVSGPSVSIPCNGLQSRDFEGPHPPPPQIHDYEWIVTAVDSSGNTVGTGSAVRKFPQ